MSSVTCTTAFDSQCTECLSPGYYPAQDGAASICTTCTPVPHCTSPLTCQSGSDSQCTQCEVGYYLDQQGVADVCLPCTAIANSTGFVTCTSVDNSQTSSCAIGYFLLNGIADQCVACTPIANSVGQISFTSATNSHTTACGVGYYRQPGGPTTPDICVPCTAVAHCTGQVSCTNAFDSQCSGCEPGYYLSGGICMPCTPVAHCISSITCTSASNSQCAQCEPGYYLNGGNCTQCPPGSYCPDGMNAFLCPAGRYSDLPGRIACIDCAAGYFSPSTGATACQACAAGSFSGVTGSISCTPCPANTYNPVMGAASCIACGVGETSPPGSIACVPPATCTQNLTIEFQTDGNPGQLSWEIREQVTNNLVQSGPPGSIAAPNGIQTVNTCVPPGCFYLRVIDSGGDGITNGGYILRTAGSPGTRIIDNRRNFVNLAGGPPDVSQIASNEGWCNPMSGGATTIFTSCDKLDWVTGDYLVCDPVTAVSAQYSGAGAATSGYEFWFFDPNGGYSFRKFRSHTVSDGFAPADASRACHIKLNNWVAASWIPANVLMNVRVRTRINNVNGSWGPACRMMIDPVRAACPFTKLMDIPGSSQFSCNVTRVFGGNSYIYAR
ncbi:MAG TPA: hypothetical protein VKG92_05710, partial [Flavobacteriales bacterium]|nr:hypothetical protein [Flavobacteriales bacterium]